MRRLRAARARAHDADPLVLARERLHQRDRARSDAVEEMRELAIFLPRA